MRRRGAAHGGPGAGLGACPARHGARGDRRSARGRAIPAPSWRARPGGCWPRRTGAGRRCSTGPRSSTRARSATLERALAELEEVGDRRPAGGADRAARGASRCRPDTVRRPARCCVSDPLSIRARRFRAVLVCGLQENEFPLAAAPEPFLSDELRRELAAAAGLRLRPREDALARERYLFYTSVSRATERVILSYRSSDEEGNLALPSPFLADVAELLDEDWAAAPAPADAVRRGVAGDDGAHRARARPGRPAARGAGAGEVPSPIGVAGRGGARATCATSQILSAGALETYADCPVRWLVERELQPERARARPRRRSPGAATCTPCSSRCCDGSAARSPPTTLPRALELLDEVLAEQAARDRGRARRGRAGRVGAGGRGRSAALSDPRGARRVDRGRSAGLELRFGFEDEPESLPRARARGGDVRLRGIIDRVDVERTTGGGRSSATTRAGRPRPEHQGARWEADRQLQVALYMIAVRELLGLEPVAGFYQPLRRRRPARARRVPARRRPGDVWWPTTAATPTSCASCSTSARDRALALAARAARRRARAVPAPPARATAASIPGSVVLSCQSTRGAAFTDEQLVAIERREGDLLLDAGAGSGKTSVLVERFVRAGARGRGRRRPRSSRSPSPRRRPRRCATGSAARLRELGADDAARATEGAFISTIHGFCARVLRAHALAAGLDPGVRRARRARGRAAGRQPPSTRRWRSSSRDDSRRLDLIAAYTAGGLRSAILRCTTSCARGASAGRVCRRSPPAPDSKRRAAELRGRARRRPASWRRSTSPAPRSSRRWAGSSGARAARGRPGAVAGRALGGGAAGGNGAALSHRRVPALHRGAGRLPRRPASTAGRSASTICSTACCAVSASATPRPSGRPRAWTSRTSS